MLIIFQPFYTKKKSVWAVLANIFILLFEGVSVYLLVRHYATGEFADGFFKTWMGIGFSCAFLLSNYILRGYSNLYHRLTYCKRREEELLLRNRDAYDPYPERVHLGTQISGSTSLTWRQKKDIQLKFILSLGEYDEYERPFDRLEHH